MSTWTQISGIIIAKRVHRRHSRTEMELDRTDWDPITGRVPNNPFVWWDYVFGKPVSPYFEGNLDFPKDIGKGKKNHYGCIKYIPFGSEGGVKVQIHKMDEVELTGMVVEDDSFYLTRKPKYYNSAYVMKISGSLRDYCNVSELIEWFNYACNQCWIHYAKCNIESDLLGFHKIELGKITDLSKVKLYSDLVKKDDPIYG